MTRQTAQPLHDWRLNSSDREAYGIVTVMLDQLDLDPPYQRGTVWTADQRVALIRSWLMGIPVPGIILNNRDNDEWAHNEGSVYSDGQRENFLPTWAVVDGKQRIETALMWFTGKLFVPASWFPADRITLATNTADGPYVSYYGLTIVGRRFVHRAFHLPIIEAKLPDLRTEAELYLLINGGGTPQSNNDMARAAQIATPTACPSQCPDQRHEHGGPSCTETDAHVVHTDEYGHRWLTESVEMLS